MDFNLFGIGLPEVFAILILLVVVVGPKRLPEMAYHIGRPIKTLQKYARAVRDEFGEEYRYLDDELSEIKEDVREINAEMREVRVEVNANVEEVQTDFREATDSINTDVNSDTAKSSPLAVAAPVNPVFHSPTANQSDSVEKVNDNESEVVKKSPPQIF